MEVFLREPRPGFLRGLREVCTELDIPLVFDEIATGARLLLPISASFLLTLIL